VEKSVEKEVGNSIWYNLDDFFRHQEIVNKNLMDEPAIIIIIPLFPIPTVVI
jgi:hypothetical protein